jgi:benzoyl-CoA reductase/2-hydroxyglutaryl-CoA dehydratase subunit BcrC/BadD/HgdB
MPIPDVVITTTNLCEISGRKFDIDKLRAAVRLSNEARKYIIKSNELRMTNPSPFSRFDGLAYSSCSQLFRVCVKELKSIRP